MKKYIRKGVPMFDAEQNEDGSYTLKNPNGKTFMLSPEQLEKELIEVEIKDTTDTENGTFE